MNLIFGKLSLFALCSLVSAASLAAGNTGWMEINMLNQRSCTTDRGLEIRFTTAHANPDVCSNNQVVEVSCSLPIYKQLLAMALTANTADMKVNAYVNGCDAQGQAYVQDMRIR
jgi:hypothetical protein